MKSNLVRLLLFLGVAGHASTVLAQSPGTFTATGDMTTARIWHTATLLTDGKVLIAGGNSLSSSGLSEASAELYDPVTGIFEATGSMTTPRERHTATLLPNGKVLIAGGYSIIRIGFPGDFLASAELYDPATGTFAATGGMTRSRGGPGDATQ